MSGIDICLEVGSKRIFASAIDWPGWCRSARDEPAALEILADYGSRYRDALAASGVRSRPPARPVFKVVQKVKGDATTDFGAPSKPCRADERRFDPKEARRQSSILRAAWSAFDAAADEAVGRSLKTGPRGGGRKLEAMIEHVLEAERGYLPRIGGSYKPSGVAALGQKMEGVREAVLSALDARAAGDPAPPSRGKTWLPRYHVRRSAWHALDHAWELEDRLT